MRQDPDIVKRKHVCGNVPHTKQQHDIRSYVFLLKKGGVSMYMQCDEQDMLCYVCVENEASKQRYVHGAYVNCCDPCYDAYERENELQNEPK